MDLKNIRRFVKLSNSDLLIIYSSITAERGPHLFDRADAELIAKLLITKKTSENLTILINTQGGEIQAAIGLMKMLRDAYKEITCIVLGVGKSSAAFIALASDNFYMHCDAVISDFSLNPNTATTAAALGKYMQSCFELFFKGVAKNLSSHHSGSEAFWALTNSFDNHGADISRADIQAQLPTVKNFESYTRLQFHLSIAHNELRRALVEAGKPAKVIGLNEELLMQVAMAPAT